MIMFIKYSARPQEKAVFGTDLMLAFDEQNITFTPKRQLLFIQQRYIERKFNRRADRFFFAPENIMIWIPTM
jgi:hypothetical protein